MLIILTFLNTIFGTTHEVCSDLSGFHRSRCLQEDKTAARMLGKAAEMAVKSSKEMVDLVEELQKST